jgi:hypothetical protein
MSSVKVQESVTLTVDQFAASTISLELRTLAGMVDDASEAGYAPVKISVLTHEPKTNSTKAKPTFSIAVLMRRKVIDDNTFSLHLARVKLADESVDKPAVKKDSAEYDDEVPF